MDLNARARTMSYYVIVILLVSHVTAAQFQNLFGNMMGNTGNSQTGNGSLCSNAVSCLPWCTRGKDANGCLTCSCNSGMNPMSGMNQMSGMNPMTGLNPMANMYSGLSGGQSPMTGGGPSLMSGGIHSPLSGGGQSPPSGGGPRTGVNCSAIPRTCPLPQPWCQRVADHNGCVKCLCGADLAVFMQNKQTQTTDSTTKTTLTTTSAVTGSSSMTTTASSITIPTPSSGMSCLTSFYCTKICDNGYKTDVNNCPVCECVNGDLIDTPVDATDPPGKKHRTTPPSTPQPIIADLLTSCPGIFDCSLICNNGYKSDHLGCPVCECMKD